MRGSKIDIKDIDIDRVSPYPEIFHPFGVTQCLGYITIYSVVPSALCVCLCIEEPQVGRYAPLTWGYPALRALLPFGHIV